MKETENMMTIPYTLWESERARQEKALKDERENHRKEKLLWFIVVIVMLIVTVGTNAFWVIRNDQMETVVTTIEAEQTAEDGGSNYAVGGDYSGYETNS